MSDDSNNSTDSLPWEEITQLIKYKKTQGLNKKTFEFALQEDNRSKVIESAWKSLKKKNPAASYQQAIVLADTMIAYARMVTEEKTKSS